MLQTRLRMLAILAFIPLILVTGCGKKHTADFKEDWQYRNETELRMLKLSAVVLVFMAKNDNRLPPMENSNVFRNSLLPIIESEKESEDILYHPKTGELFEPNTAVSSQTLQQLESRNKRILIGTCRGDDKVASGVLFFDPKDTLLIVSSTWPTGGLEHLKQNPEQELFDESAEDTE